MADESYSFSTARTRLEEIVSQVRKKDTSLEKSLDLLEEGVRLANACTELIDHQDWAAPAASSGAEEGVTAPSTEEPELAAGDSVTLVVGDIAVIEDVVLTDADGEFVAEVMEVREYEPSEEFSETDDAWADESELPADDESDDPSAPEG